MYFPDLRHFCLGRQYNTELNGGLFGGNLRPAHCAGGSTWTLERNRLTGNPTDYSVTVTSRGAFFKNVIKKTYPCLEKKRKTNKPRCVADLQIVYFDFKNTHRDGKTDT